ncbi:MAG TPA: MEDS domain-containing protein [Nitrospira sp.]|nr:MEDS domain-containing protein [Nitrospira sp.]
MKNHSVYFYEDDTFLIHKVAQFVNTGLEREETVIVVATDQHRDDLKLKLIKDEVIGLSAWNARNYVTLDASETLALFMRNGWPDEHLFLSVIGQIIQSAAAAKPVRIYGEMVAVLFAEGNSLAAIQLERLWNKLAGQRPFSLLCGYPAATFQTSDMDYAYENVCACHSAVDSRKKLAA